MTSNTESLLGTNTNSFVEGQYVDVQSRTWPGINKPGGIGRISGVSGDRVSVRYLVGRRHEKEIKTQFVKPYNLSSERLRDRSHLKGRCTRCGSLRNDCGSCDIWTVEEVASTQDEGTPIRRSTTKKMKGDGNDQSVLEETESPERMDFEPDSQSSSSSSDEQIEAQERRYRQYTRLKKKAKQILENCMEGPDTSGESSGESDNDNVPLRQLVRQELLSQLSPIRSKQRRRHVMRRNKKRGHFHSVLEGISESEDELVSLSGVSPSRSMSPPGTPDFSVEGSEPHEMDAPMIDGSSSEAESEASDATVQTDDKVLDSTLRDFIQPEGDASRLPRDTVDRTAGLEFEELGVFFDDLACSLENETIPLAKEMVKELTEQLASNRNLSQSNRALHEECNELYDTLMTKLVRNGIDQCQRALNRLEVKPDLQLENRGLLWDKLHTTIEEVMKEVRALVKVSDNLELDFDNDEANSADGWAEPTDSPLGAKSNRENPDKFLASQESTSFWGLHPYASKKRKGRTFSKSKRKVTRKKPAKIMSKDRPKENGQELMSNISKVSQHEKENLVNDVSSPSNNSKSLVKQSKRRYAREADKNINGRRRLSGTAVERMERFLSLNTAHKGNENETDNWDGDEIDDFAPLSIRGRRFQQRKCRLAEDAPAVSENRECQEQGLKRRNKYDADPSIPQAENEPLSDYLFRDLRSRQCRTTSHFEKHSDLVVKSVRTVLDVCEDLVKTFPQLPSCSLFKELLILVCTSSDGVESSNIFVIATSLLKNLGCPTIQELVSRDSPQLMSYVALYVCILELMKRNIHHRLSAHHGISYKLFGASDSKFIEFLFVQFVDAVYALAHPDAWVVNVPNRRQIFEALAPLRDALGEHFALIEKASCFIDTRLGNQTWRLVSSRRISFVSSIDPDSWKLYIEQGIEREVILQSRLRQIGNVPCIPRVEVETLWRVLAYLAASTHTLDPEKRSRYRWKFVPDILAYGVFRMTSKIGSPPLGHLQAIAEDIHALSSIISSGAMGSLPRKDVVAVDIIMKSLQLHADALSHNEDFREAQFPTINDGKSELKRESLRWDSSRDLLAVEVSTFAPIETTELLKILLSAPNRPSAYIASRAASDILHSSLVLQFAWMANAQRESDSRMHQCNQSFGALVKHLQGESTRAFRDGKDYDKNDCDAFHDAFPDHSMCKKGLPDSRRSLFLQECATYLSIVASISSTVQHGADQKDSTMLAIVKKAWEMLGDDEMGDPRETLKRSKSTSCDILRPFVMGKVLDMLSSCALGLIPATENETTVRSVPDFMVDKEAICYIISSLTRCLEVSTYSGSSEIIYSIARMTEKVVYSIYQAILADRLDHRSLASVADELLAGSTHASINTINALVKASFCGAEEDVCLLSVLSVVRAVFSFRRMTQGGIEPLLSSSFNVHEATNPSDQLGDEMWGDLNDDELLCMMDSVDGGGLSQGDSTNRVLQSLQELRLTLSESLKCAIPSLRYEISYTDRNAEPSRMSSHGKLLVSRRIKAICTTLIFMLVSEHCLSFSSIADIVDLQVSANVGDEEYRRKVMLYCCHGLCNFTQSPKAYALIQCSSSSMVSVLIDTLLDIKLLQNVPSSHFDRLCDDEHDVLKRKVIGIFLKFSSGNSSLRGKMAKMWTFCRNLGNALSKSHENSLSLFKQIGEDLSNQKWNSGNESSRDLPCSLETEFFDRYRCLRGIISAYRQFGSPDKSFSELCAEITARTCEGLLRILKLLHVDDAASKGSKEPSCSKYRLTELFRCHSEFSASVIAWIFREGSHVPTSHFTNMWTAICNDFVVPIISSDTIDVYTCIETTYANVSKCVGTPPLSLPKVVGLEANGECRRILFSNLINYSKEILLPMLCSQSPSPQLFDNFLSAAVRNPKVASKSICRIFYKELDLAVSSLTENDDSQLVQHLGEYWESLQRDHPLDLKVEDELASLKQHAVETLVAIAKRNKRDPRQGALLIINYILKRERNAPSESLKIEVVCSLLRVLPLILKGSLLEPAVDEGMIILIYKCLHGVSKLRSLSVKNHEDETFKEWCAVESLQPEHENPKTSLSAKYVTRVLAWFEAIGDIIQGHTNDCDRERIRRQLIEADSDGWSSWESICSVKLAHISLETKDIENQLFPSLNPNRVVHNMYAATKRTQPTDDNIENWVPSNCIRQIISRTYR